MTSQSRVMSFYEVLIGRFVGYMVSTALGVWVLPFFGFQATVGQSASIAAIFVAASMCYSYALRRFFEWIKS